MERPEKESLVNFTRGKKDGDTEWYSASFERNGLELEATRYENQYSIRWDARTPSSELLEALEPFYRFSSRIEVSTPDYRDRSFSLDSETGDRLGLYDLDAEEVKKTGFDADDFSVTWRQHGKLLEDVPGSTPYSMTFYFEDPPDYSTDPFVEPVWHSLRQLENLDADSTDRLVRDATEFLSDAEKEFR